MDKDIVAAKKEYKDMKKFNKRITKQAVDNFLTNMGTPTAADLLLIRKKK